MILSANQIILLISVILIFARLLKLKDHIQRPFFHSIIQPLEWLVLIIGLFMFFRNFEEVIETLKYGADTIWPELKLLAEKLFIKLKILLHELTKL
ncbi:MAG TPA: hypothetical protein GXX18_06305 [Bacillales bacterium]|nr:hypothetical protein [Bacillales bacterium]